MMDMEMNTELDKDGESESGEPSTEGSSAGSAYCTLEQDYARIKSEMHANEALTAYVDEYTRLFETLYKAQRREEELAENYRFLQEESRQNVQRITDLEKTIEACNKTISTLTEELDYAKKMENVSHDREYKAQNIIKHQKMTITKLREEVEKKKRLDEEDSMAVSKEKDLSLREKDKLAGEIEILLQRNKTLLLRNEELEQKYGALSQEQKKIQTFSEIQTNELIKERALREKLENKIKKQGDEMIRLNTELQFTNVSMTSITDKVIHLESVVKEYKITVENNDKNIDKLIQEKVMLKKDVDILYNQKEKIANTLIERKKELETLKQDVNRTREECLQLKAEKNAVSTKLAKEQNVCNKIKKDLQQAKTDKQNCDQEVVDLKKCLESLQKEKDNLIREKESLAKSIILTRDSMRKLSSELKGYEQAQRKLESDLDKESKLLNNVKKELFGVEKERDKVIQENHELVHKLEKQSSEIHMHQLEMSEHKKLLLDADARYKQLQNVLDRVKSERNECKKNLNETQSNVETLKEKLKVKSYQVEQLREEISIKDKNLNQEEFQLGRVEKDKDDLKLKLHTSQKYAQSLRHEIEELKKEEKQLRNEICTANANLNKQRKEIDAIMSERDILGTHLVKKNDEINIQNEKIKHLIMTIQQGESRYTQCLEDIRLLKLEIKKIRTEKALLSKSISNTCDLRHEVFHLQRELTKERLKITALEEETQNPINVHRWRKLEGTDPDVLESQQKIHLLNKRVIQLGSNLENKNKVIKDYDEKCRILEEVISKQRKSDCVKSLSEIQIIIRSKDEKIKSLSGELNMYESSQEEYKLDIERLSNELHKFKEKYYSLKQKERKVHSSKTHVHEIPLIPLIEEKIITQSVT